MRYMNDRLPDLPSPLYARSAATYIADATGVDVRALTLTSSTPRSFTFHAPANVHYTLKVLIGRRDGVIITT